MLKSHDVDISLILDLFWTFGDSAYLTIFKILFIGSSGYTIYLMLNDYKPTHDPNIDTFKVQYLLGASALLAILFPQNYKSFEVCISCLGYRDTLSRWSVIDSLDLFNLARVRCDTSTIVHVTANRWSGNNHNTLSFCPWTLSSTVYSKLDLSLLCWEPFWSRSRCCRYHPDGSIFRLFLYLLHKVSWIRESILITVTKWDIGFWRARNFLSRYECWVGFYETLLQFILVLHKVAASIHPVL